MIETLNDPSTASECTCCGRESYGGRNRVGSSNAVAAARTALDGGVEVARVANDQLGKELADS